MRRDGSAGLFLFDILNKTGLRIEGKTYARVMNRRIITYYMHQQGYTFTDIAALFKQTRSNTAKLYKQHERLIKTRKYKVIYYGFVEALEKLA